MQVGNRRQTGFTLVEIAIVLVIIGLLLGGILKGQEMIVQAKIKNVMAEMSGVGAAYYGYRDRYRAIPGDDKDAGTRWTGSQSGDNNGIVAGAYNQDCAGTLSLPTWESCYWWDHLRRSGFVAGNGLEQPLNAFTGKIGVQTGDGSSATAPAAALASGGVGLTGIIVCSANLLDKVAIALDAQMDDGQIGAGVVRAMKQTTPGSPAISAAADTTPYAETGVTVYTTCRAL